MNKELASLEINGTRKVDGGEYSDVEINGFGRILGDLKCGDFSCNGKGTVKGNLEAGDIDVNGAASFRGDVTADELEVNGSTSIYGDFKADHTVVNGRLDLRQKADIERLRVQGYCRVEGELRGGHFEVNGQLHVEEDCTCDRFDGHGRFVIDGLLSAETIDIGLFWHSKAREIGGHSVKIFKRENLLSKIASAVHMVFSKKNIRLDVDVIEADEIEISDTKAKIVRGQNVMIGENCEIELLEYSGTFEQHETAKIKEVKQLS